MRLGSVEAGIKYKNRKDLTDLPKTVTQGVKIVPVRWIDEVLDVALERPLTPANAAPPTELVPREPEAKPAQPDARH